MPAHVHGCYAALPDCSSLVTSFQYCIWSGLGRVIISYARSTNDTNSCRCRKLCNSCNASPKQMDEPCQYGCLASQHVEHKQTTFSIHPLATLTTRAKSPISYRRPLSSL